MKILKTLWGELKGVFGKSYLLAGTLPAAVLVLGWLWYRSRKSLPSLVGRAVDALGAERAADEALALILLTLVLGLAFFAGRGPLLDLLQRLPGRLLAPLRRTLVQRQHQHLLQVEREADVRSHLVTILEKWIPSDEMDFGPPTFLPPTERIPKEAAVRKSSKRARATVRRLLPHGIPPTTPPSREQTGAILGALRQLYAYAARHYPDRTTIDETSAWRLLLSSGGARRLLGILTDGVRREWAEARMELDSFPEPRWLRPTGLGTRASALDDYAEDRYGIPTSTMVQRLLGALPAEEQKQIGDARLQVETLANLAASSVLLAFAVTVGSLALATRHLRAGGLLEWDARTAAFVLMPALFGWLFYRAAVLAHGELAEKLVRTVDLYRLELIEKLGFARPRDVREERELWCELAAFYAGDGDLDPDRPIQPKEKE